MRSKYFFMLISFFIITLFCSASPEDDPVDNGDAIAATVKPSPRALITSDGLVIEATRDNYFRVKLDNDQIVLASAAGRIRKNKLRILAGDRVRLEIVPPIKSSSRGRIVRRLNKS
uniref:S1-like domain-containing protein n=1 Tax=Acrobeloides nanus TaxID=290746 RepID=A0A914EL60_9BILA